MTEKSLFEHQRALHRHAEEVLTRVVNNEELMAQILAGIERLKRGAHGTPLREIQEQERRLAAEG